MKNVLAVVFCAATCAFATQASATTVVYDAVLNGPSESPANASPGTGVAEVDVDLVASTMRVRVSFFGLSSDSSASHIQCCTSLPGTGTAGVATGLVNFPLGVMSGTYDQTFDLTLDSTYNPTFETAHGGTAASAEAALVAGLNGDEAYLDIHTATFPSGEIRGFLLAAVVPEPSTWAMMILGFGGIGFMAYRKKKPGAAVAAA